MTTATQPAWMAGEREVLLHYLNKMRDAVLRTAAGLPEQQQRAAGVPSGTSLLGIVRHLTAVEEHWFQRVFLDADIVPDLSMDVPADVPAEQVLTAYRLACARSDEIVRDCPDLGTPARGVNPGEEHVMVPLRAIVAHMIEETGRHAGHADILRERIDGAIGL